MFKCVKIEEIYLLLVEMVESVTENGNRVFQQLAERSYSTLKTFKDLPKLSLHL
jgi:uncharacterized membrane protein